MFLGSRPVEAPGFSPSFGKRFVTGLKPLMIRKIFSVDTHTPNAPGDMASPV